MPVNKEAPLTWRRGDRFLKRFALTFGLTLGDFDDERAEPMFTSVNVFVGAGYRVTEAIRIGGGIVAFRQKADAFSNRDEVVFSPYSSVSFD